MFLRDCGPPWAQYSVLAESNDARSGLQEKLKEKGIPTAIYYPKALHVQTAFEFLKYKERGFPCKRRCLKKDFQLTDVTLFGKGYASKYNRSNGINRFSLK